MSRKEGGLLRVAEFPEYSVALNDVRAVLRFAAAEDVAPMEAIARLDEISEITEAGKQGLALLWSHLSSVQSGTSVAALLSEYLFTQSRYLDTVLTDDTVAGACKRVAIFQLLQFAIEYRPTGSGNPRQQMLRWVRRLEVFGDERQLRQMPSSASGIDAVRMLTVHASKGLEFGAVYLPALGTTIFPASRKHNQCPPPEGMLGEDPKDSHADEEECLFFVAISRARDILSLSRAANYPGMKRRSSPLLLSVATHLPKAPDGPPGWCSPGPPSDLDSPLVHLAAHYEVHNAEDLDQYIRCPRTYLYQRILDLSGARDDGAYIQFHRAVYSVLRWMGGEKKTTPVSHEEAKTRLDTAWAKIGPVDHPFAAVYRNAADNIVNRAVARRSCGAEILDADWLIERPGGTIRLRPDHVEMRVDGPVVRRLRTGRPPKGKPDDDIYALYHQAAQQQLGQAHVEVLYLTTDEVKPAPMTSAVVSRRLAKYDAAIAGIGAGRFPAKPNDRVCPRCPQYFICPAVPSSRPID